MMSRYLGNSFFGGRTNDSQSLRPSPQKWLREKKETHGAEGDSSGGQADKTSIAGVGVMDSVRVLIA